MRAQLMVEFITLIGISMLVLGIAVSIIISEASRASQTRHDSAVREQHERLRSELFAAYLAHEGYTTQLEFTPPYRGVAMNLTISDGSIRIESEKTTTGSTLTSVTGTVELSSGTVTITRTDESVIVI